jgi:hypothetical protein
MASGKKNAGGRMIDLRPAEATCVIKMLPTFTLLASLLLQRRSPRRIFYGLESR